MMTKDEKKELFLSILENWFDDYSGQINPDNCIGFYNYFLDCLDFEIHFSPEYEPGFHDFLTVIFDVLADFPSYVDCRISDKIGLKGIIFSSEKNIKAEDVDSMLIKLNELFVMFRDEYLL